MIKKNYTMQQIMCYYYIPVSIESVVWVDKSNQLMDGMRMKWFLLNQMQDKKE